MKAFLWSLCLHLVLLGLLTYHRFAPPEAAKIKTEPPILAYTYQPVKPKVSVEPSPGPVAVVKAAPVVQSAVKPAVKKTVTKENKAKVIQGKFKKTAAKQTSTAAKKPQKAAVQPERKAFVPLRKPAMVTPPPAPVQAQNQLKPEVTTSTTTPELQKKAATEKPKPEVKPVVAAEPKPEPAVKPVVAAGLKPEPEVKALAEPKPAPVLVAATALPETKPAQIQPQVKIAEVKTDAKPEMMPLKPAKSGAESGTTNSTTVASKALQAATLPAASAEAGSWKEKQKQLALEITATKAKDKPEIGKKVKAFADGSSLIDTNPGCWKVPPPESRQNAIWLSTSIPCKADTTAEQINDILQKRRSYTKD